MVWDNAVVQEAETESGGCEEKGGMLIGVGDGSLAPDCSSGGGASHTAQPIGWHLGTSVKLSASTDWTAFHLLTLTI